MIYTKFKLFLEARLSDILNIKGDSELASQMKKIKDAEFDLSKKLVKFITLILSFLEFWLSLVREKPLCRQ